MAKKVHTLSKSRFLTGLQCHKRLWWEFHEPDAPELEADRSTQFLFDQGTEVGRVARNYVPGGILIDLPHWEMERRIELTQQVLDGGTGVLYEATFAHEGVRVFADILERHPSGWRLIEVKSTTKVKPVHVPDLAVQAHVLRGAGLTVTRYELMHLNRECRHPDLSNLFEREDISTPVKQALPGIEEEVREQKQVLAGSLPEVAIGDHCYEPYECPFVGRCWPEDPPHPIHSLFRLMGNRKEKFKDHGYETILDVPEDEPMTVIQKRQQKAVRTDRVVVETTLAKALKQIREPAAFMDFESVAPAIPVWSGCRPFDQVPVQVSVHRPIEGGHIHEEWLAEGPEDPREELARQLIEFCRGARSIVVYNATFERRCIRGLREHLPHLAGELEDVEGRLVDLFPMVMKHVYHPAFGGSFSLKKVLPALVPSLDYGELELASGEDASQALLVLLLRGDDLDAKERAQRRQQLLAYCKLDTWAMVKLVEALKLLAS